MRRRRAYVVTLTILAASGVIALIVTAQPWATMTFLGPLGTDSREASGTELTGAVRAVGLLSLAGVLAVLATKGWTRRAIGVGITAAGLVAAFHVIQTRMDLTEIVAAWARTGPDAVTVRPTPAIWVATLVCLTTAAAGVATASGGHRWPNLLAKYDRRRHQAAEDAWDLLDRGEDPTV